VAKTSLGQRENECDDFLHRKKKGRKEMDNQQPSLFRIKLNSKNK
jgi:hypothetical protein